MKRFIISVLFVSVFCIGLGALVDNVGAKFKSDEKALALIRAARIAIGGDTAVAGVKSMTIIGQTTRTFKIDGTDRVEQGETEIAMQLPNKLMKMEKIGHGDDAAGGNKTINKQVEVFIAGNADAHQKIIVNGEGKGDRVGSGNGVNKIIIKKDDGTVQELTGAEADKVIAGHSGQGGKNVIIKKADGTVEELKGAEAHTVILRNGGGDNEVWTAKGGKPINVDGKHLFMENTGDHHEAMRHNEMLRLTLGLLLTAPDGMDVNYTYGGERDVDGTVCNVVVAEFAGSAFKLYLGKSSNLPVMMSYSEMKMPQIMAFRREAPIGGEDTKDTLVFNRKIEGPAHETAEFQVKFSDYRSTGGLQLPYRWTQTVGGVADEAFDVTSYEINPANIADKFNNQNVKVKVMKKPDGK